MCRGRRSCPLQVYSHKGESAGSRRVEWEWPVGTAVAASAGRAPAPSAAAPPDSSSSSPTSSSEAAAVCPPSSLLSARGKQTPG